MRGKVGWVCAVLLGLCMQVTAKGDHEGVREVGSCLVVGVSGTQLDGATANALRYGRVAGIILLAENIESVDQVQELIRQAKLSANAGGFPEPLICIDQEGGKVNRLRFLSGFPDDPSAASMAGWHAADIEQQKYQVGAFMHALGINVDFAPDVDLYSGNGIIGNRSFGTDPDSVKICAAAEIQGFHRAGVAAIIKHFPGHGMTRADSHQLLPKVSVTGKVLGEHESAFAKTMAAGPDGAMLAHLLIKNVDAKYPASLSSTFARKLRSIVGSDRLIFTDSGSMAALARYGPEASRAARSLSVGVDVYLTTTPLSQLGARFQEKVLSRIQSHAALKAAAQRVTNWRKRLPSGS